MHTTPLKFAAALVSLLISGTAAACAQNATAAVVPARAAAPAAVIVTTENPAVTHRAMEWFGRLQSGDVDRAQLTTAISAKLTPAAVAAMKKQLAPLGAPTGIAFGGARDVKGDMVYRYVVVFTVGAIQEFMSLDKSGKISGVLFLPVR